MFFEGIVFRLTIVGLHTIQGCIRLFFGLSSRHILHNSFVSLVSLSQRQTDMQSDGQADVKEKRDWLRDSYFETETLMMCSSSGQIGFKSNKEAAIRAFILNAIICYYNIASHTVTHHSEGACITNKGVFRWVGADGFNLSPHKCITVTKAQNCTKNMTKLNSMDATRNLKLTRNSFLRIRS